MIQKKKKEKKNWETLYYCIKIKCYRRSEIFSVAIYTLCICIGTVFLFQQMT